MATSTLTKMEKEKMVVHGQPERDLIPTEPPPDYTPQPLPLPCVIPQTSKSIQGAFASPFVRAYAPELAACGISQSEFLTFIDGLNEAFVSNPVMQGTSIVGAIMGQAYGVHPVQLAGIGLQVASGLGSAAVSYARAKAYMKAMNQDFFGPLGLQAKVFTTKDMMKKVEHEDEKLQLPPLENVASLDDAALSRQRTEAGDERAEIQPDDPRLRRMRALEGYVLPLDFNMPESVAPNNMLRRMGNAQANRMARKQHKKTMKKRAEGEKKFQEKSRESDKKQREGDKEIAKIERKMGKERAKFDKKSMKKKALNDPEEKAKITKEFEKETAKLQKEMDKETRKRDKEVAKYMKEGNKELAKPDKKENKIANKIRWVVITRLEGDGESSSSEDIPDDDDEESLDTRQS